MIGLACLGLATLNLWAAVPGLELEPSEGPNPWTRLDLHNGPEDFHLAILGDRTGEHRRGVFRSAIEKLNLLRPDLVLSVGDLIEGYTESVPELEKQWAELTSIVGKLKMPFFYLPGNHDLANRTQLKVWEKRHGRSYYHFVYRRVLFLLINTEDPPSSAISDAQLEYFRGVLEAKRDVRWTILLMHKPMWKPSALDGETKAQIARATKAWETLEGMLDGRPYTVFAGDEHVYQKTLRRGQRHYILSTTGGTGDGPNGRLLGQKRCQFDHLMWVTMTDEGPLVANLRLDGILSDEPCPNAFKK